MFDWENYVDTKIGRPQQLVNQLLAEYADNFVLFMGVLGQTLGTPTGTNEQGQCFASATIEGYYWALCQHKNIGLLEIKWLCLNAFFTLMSFGRQQTKKEYEQWKEYLNYLLATLIMSMPDYV